MNILFKLNLVIKCIGENNVTNWFLMIFSGWMAHGCSDVTMLRNIAKKHRAIFCDFSIFLFTVFYLYNFFCLLCIYIFSCNFVTLSQAFCL